jgi:hypothetical protein
MELNQKVIVKSNNTQGTIYDINEKTNTVWVETQEDIYKLSINDIELAPTAKQPQNLTITETKRIIENFRNTTTTKHITLLATIETVQEDNNIEYSILVLSVNETLLNTQEDMEFFDNELELRLYVNHKTKSLIKSLEKKYNYLGIEL